MLNFIHRHIGARLSELRSRHGLSRTELGKAADVSLFELGAFEAGVMPMPAEAMHGLCRALNVVPRDLFEGLELPDRLDSTDTAHASVSLLDELVSSRRKARLDSLRGAG